MMRLYLYLCQAVLVVPARQQLWLQVISDGKVQVVNNQRISVTMRQSVMDAKALADKGKNAEEIKDILEAHKMDSSIYITLETLKYLKKGGRITPGGGSYWNYVKAQSCITDTG